MAHPNSNAVVGGIEQPRFLLCGPELSRNISFEDDMSGVDGAGATRALDTGTPWGDYVLKVEDDESGATEYAEITIETGGPIAGKHFVATFFARNDAAEGWKFFHTDWEGLTGTHTQQYEVSQSWTLCTHEVAVPHDASGNDLAMRVYPFAAAQGDAGEGAVRIDYLRVREVKDWFELPMPARGRLNIYFGKEVRARNDLENGSRKSYRRGLRFHYESRYDKLTPQQEILRGLLLDTPHEILLFPHRDSGTCFFVEWDDDYSRNFALGVAAVGHEGSIRLRGTELYPALPQEIIDALTVYMPPADVLIGEGNVGFF